MTLATLKKVCAAYHQKTTAELTVDSVDLFLVAANNARKKAERLHNFELARVQATLDIDGVTGASLDDADFGGETVLSGYVISGTAGSLVGGDGTYLAAGGDLDDVTVYTYAVDNGLHVLYYSQGDAGWWLGKGVSDYPDFGANGYSFSTASDSPVGTYAGNGTATGSVTIVAGTAEVTTSFASIKEVKDIFRTRADGTLVPIDFSNPNVAIERDRYELELSDDYFPGYRYPSDAQLLSTGSGSCVIQRGRRLYIYPSTESAVTPVTLTLECYGWLSDYDAAALTDTEPTDFFVEHCSDYLQWAIVCELNYRFQTFVTRTEGNLTMPEREREAAWRDVLLWDSYLVDSNTTRSR